MAHVIEAKYPVTFRFQEVQALGTAIRQHDSVSLIGMKRVGISNFLRFFLNHEQVISNFITPSQHIFVVVDLNNLVERTLYAFWILTLKKIVDAVEVGPFSEKIKEESKSLFTQSIQLGDLFFTIDAIHKVLSAVGDEDKYLTLFFLRFDRLKDVITSEFFANIKGLKDSGNHLSYVFTSYRPLSEIIPIITRSALSGFVKEIYVKPATSEDMKSICESFQEQYDTHFSQDSLHHIQEISGGHVQYLNLLLLSLKNKVHDEEVLFLSEEICASLTKDELEYLKKISANTHPLPHVKSFKYLWETGIVVDNSHPVIFSPVLSEYIHTSIQSKKNNDAEFTRKEHALFSILKKYEGQLVEREKIIEAVWPEVVELGVSDWSIDRLVSRVRTKLLDQKSEYKIMTVITRGYKLVNATTE